MTSFALACVLGLPAARAADRVADRAADKSIELYATTDIHGHLEPSLWRHGVSADPAHPILGGGLALLGGFLANARAHYPGRVLLVDGGDLFQGTLASNQTEGASMLRGLDQLGYAAAAVGNHEFDYGPAGPAPTPTAAGEDPRGALKSRMKEATFPLLGANITLADGTHPFPTYIIRNVDGIPVGIVGGTSESLFETTIRANLEGLVVGPLAPALLAAARQARAHGARVIVVTVHAGAECDRSQRALTDRDHDALDHCTRDSEIEVLAHAFATEARKGGIRVSAIVAGHTHQPNTMIIDGIPVIQSGQNGHYLSHVTLHVSGHGKSATPTGRFEIERSIEVCARYDDHERCAPPDDATAHQASYFGLVSPDAAVTAAIAADLARAHALADRPVGVTLPVGLPTEYSSESPLGNFFADALRRATKADVGIMNAGGIRASLPVGPLTYGALYETFPFDNVVIAIDLTGAELYALAEHNLASPFGALSYSGLHVVCVCEAGHEKTTLTLTNGKPIDRAAHYRIGTVDFLASGGDGMLVRPATPSLTLGTVRAVLEEALHAHGGVLLPSEPGLFDLVRRRVDVPMPRPVHCP
ncbi:MAG: 5'-nucleotidase C-terminal domain-containing protein [Polyangia bacterium]